MRAQRHCRLLSVLAGLGLGAICVVAANGRTWKSASGKHTLEAEFVKLEGGNITLRTTAGKETTFPLTNLQPENQAMATKLAANLTLVDGEVKASHTHWFSKTRKKGPDGEWVATKRVKINLTLTGGDAARVFRIVEIDTDPIDTGSEKIPLEKLSWGKRQIIYRDSRELVEQPSDGILFDLEFKHLPGELEEIPEIKGSVLAMAGGEPAFVELEDLLTRETGSIKDVVLEKVGKTLKFHRRDDETIEDMVTIGMDVEETDLLFAGITLVGPDGERVKTRSTGTQYRGDHARYDISAESASFKDAKLRIEFRPGAEQVEIPFNLTVIGAE